MDRFTYGVLLLTVISFSSISNASVLNSLYFDVTHYGATSGDNSDDSQAFLKAWNAACAKSSESTIYVPIRGIFLINPLTFEGPCRAPAINFFISGTILAPNSPRSWAGKDPSVWLEFKNVRGLHVAGSGLVNGQGQGWWDQSCKYHSQLKTCTKLAPTAWKFIGCTDSSVRGLRIINSAQTHILVNGGNNFSIEKVSINSPGNSPNTDGIHVSSSQNVFIHHSNISSGDDCISIGDHVSNLEIGDIHCGPGHGISIGSLGSSGSLGREGSESKVQVENIIVNGASFYGTSNGARIKTRKAGEGTVRNVTFENLTFNQVKNPIIIDQHYCDDGCKFELAGAGIQIRDVTYRNIRGTSASDVAINLNCINSQCWGIYMESIKISSANDGKKVSAQCSNAYGREVDVVPAGPCLWK